jgi:hypothetical protein
MKSSIHLNAKVKLKMAMEYSLKLLMNLSLNIKQNKINLVWINLIKVKTKTNYKC